MKCPNDGTTLNMSAREGIEIDYCPTCRGVWLDRGELDKIIERSTGTNDSQPVQRRPDSQTVSRDEYRHVEHDNHYRKKKKESFLGDLFDF